MAWPPPTFSHSQEAHLLPPGSGQPRSDTWDQREPVTSEATAVSNSWVQDPKALCGSLVGNRYRLHRVQGRGQRSVVYRGECEQTGKRVAVKLLSRPVELSNEHFRWEVRQAVSLALFEHRAARSVIDFGPIEGGGVFLVRNGAAGMPLRSLLQQGRLPATRALPIAVQIADALAAAHAMDVVHGQLTPENVLVEESAERGDQVTVVDFGLADLGGLVSSNDNESRLLSLRARLYAPAAGPDGAVPRGASADVYSLAVILFEMLAGQPPFPFDEELLTAQDRGPALRLDQCQPRVSVSRETATLVGRLLTPGAAIGSAATLAETLRGQAVAARSREPSRPRQSVPPRAALPEGGYLSDPDPDDDAVTRQVPSVSELPPAAHGGLSVPPSLSAFVRPNSGYTEPPRSSGWALQAPPLGAASPHEPDEGSFEHPGLMPPPPSFLPPGGPTSELPNRAHLAPSPIPLVPEYAAASLVPDPGPYADDEVDEASAQMAPVSLGIDIDTDEPPHRRGLVGFLKRLFGIPERPAGF